MVTGRGEIKLEGFALAVLGFSLSRLAVAESISVVDPIPFLFTELPPLMLGLGLAVWGVVLAVGPASRPYVRAVTAWALLGTVIMGAAISLTVLGVALRGESILDVVLSNMLVANVVLAGAIGGAIIGDRSAKNRQYRAEVKRQVDRARFLNRLLRHEVLNAAHVIQGYGELLEESNRERSSTAIQNAATRIDETITEVGDLVDDRDGELDPVDLTAVVEEELERLNSDRISVTLPDAAYVLADSRLRWIVAELVENALEYAPETGENPEILVSVSVDAGIVRLRIKDHGPGLPERNIRVLERGDFPDYDDPASGFGVQAVRLLVDTFGGAIAVDRSEGTEITVSFPRVTQDGAYQSGFRARTHELSVAAFAAVAAGVAMGIYMQFSMGLLPVIGSLYGIENELIGWITHLFHSVVFGLLFAATLARPTFARCDGLLKRNAVGIGWGIVLWLLAAGMIMPIWLHLVGQEALLPNLTGPGLLAHLLWGVVLATVYSGLVGREAVLRVTSRIGPSGRQLDPE